MGCSASTTPSSPRATTTRAPRRSSSSSPTSRASSRRARRTKDDLITVFAHAEIDGQKLPLIDVLAWCQIIVSAGNETTRNATTGGMLALIEHPAERRKMAQAANLRSGIEEILRWTSPIIHFARTASADTVVGGHAIAEGDVSALFYPSANRDEDVFVDPYRFDVTRKPNRHLAFGVGEHFCAGAHVARLELEMAYKYLLPRLEEVELAGPPDRTGRTWWAASSGCRSGSRRSGVRAPRGAAPRHARTDVPGRTSRTSAWRSRAGAPG
ncbi:MAG: cytochrome P450 [Myxococcota bacterium]